MTVEYALPTEHRRSSSERKKMKVETNHLSPGLLQAALTLDFASLD
jgi:hypothetical protein